MKTVTLFLTLALAAAARPPIETPTWEVIYPQMIAWRKSNQTFHRVTYPDLRSPNLPGDVLMVELYRGQTINKGDIILFEYKGELTAREVGSVVNGIPSTVLGTKVTNVYGIARRALRIRG